jgi:hypothetical protein
LCDRFAGRRVLFTLSKDNHLDWVADWAGFYASVHGCDAGDKRRHRDFVCRDPGDDRSPPKWAAVPVRCPDSAVWRVHYIAGMTSDSAVASRVQFQHFKAINTGWREDRYLPGVIAGPDVRVDADLAESMARVAWPDRP